MINWIAWNWDHLTEYEKKKKKMSLRLFKNVIYKMCSEKKYI